MSALQIQLRETQTVGPNTRERDITREKCPELAEFSLMWAGISDAQYGFSFVRHRPERDSVRFTIAGAGEVFADGRWQSSEPGSAYLTPAHHAHAYRAARGKMWTLCWMTFAESATSQIVTVDRPTIWQVDPRPIHAAVLGLHAEISGHHDPLFTRRWLELLSQTTTRLITQRNPADRLWKLWAEVESRLAHPWTRDELASLSAMSGENLRLICQSQHGRSPLQHVTHLRMQRAASLLLASTHKVAMIASAVGYADAFSFSTAFRRWAGRSPAHYRKQRSINNML